MPTDEGDRERVTGVEGDGEREGFHFISLSFLASYTDAISFRTFANNEAILPYPNMKTNCTRASVILIPVLPHQHGMKCVAPVTG